MKYRFLFIPAILIVLFLLTCNINSNKSAIKTKAIEIKLLSMFPIDSSELFGKSLFQIYQPIVILKGDSSYALNAFEKGYKIEILKVDNSGEKSFTINGNKAWWDIQLFGKPKIEKLNELACSNFEGERYEKELIKGNTISNCELTSIQNKLIYKYDSMGYGILIYDTECFNYNNSTDSLYLNKYRVYQNYEDLLNGIKKMYTLKKERFLIAHKLICCSNEKPSESILEVETMQEPVSKIVKQTPEDEKEEMPLGDISYSNNYLYFSKCNNCPIDILITKKHGKSQNITINDYKKNSLNIQDYDLLTYEEYNIKITDKKGDTKFTCVVPISNGSLCDCKK
jgi:hypothetical protein